MTDSCFLGGAGRRIPCLFPVDVMRTSFERCGVTFESSVEWPATSSAGDYTITEIISTVKVRCAESR